MPKPPVDLADLETRIRLEAQLLARRKQRLAPASIPKSDDTAPIPVAPAQHRIWFYEKILDQTIFNVVQATRLSGPLDIDCLTRAFDGVVNRHQPLRSVIVVEEGVVRMVPSRVLPRLAVERVAWEEDRLVQINRHVEDMAVRSFDLESEPPIHCKLLQFDEQEFLLVTVMHHIACDEWSVRLFNSELDALYTSHLQGLAVKLPELPVSFSDFAAWQHKELANGRWSASLQYWQSHLQGADPQFSLCVAPQLVSMPRGALGEFEVALSPSTGTALDALGRARGATPFMVMLAVAMATLHRRSGKSDIAIATQVAGRNQPELANLIGVFTNTIVVRTRCEADTCFDTFLAGIREQIIASLTHGEYPFDMLVRQLPGVRAGGEAMPFGRIMFRHRQRLPSPLRGPELKSTPVNIPRETAKFDFSIVIIDEGEVRSVKLQYDSSLIDAADMELFANKFCDIAAAIAADPKIRISQFPANRNAPSTECAANSGAATDIRAEDRGTGRRAIEDRLTQICTSLLGGRTIDRRASFFEAGGDSLSFLQLLFKIEEAFSVKLGMAEVFRESTIMAIADRIREAKRSPGTAFPGANKLVTPLLSSDDLPGNVQLFFLIDGAAGIPIRFAGTAQRLSERWCALAALHPEMVPGEAEPETLSAVVARMKDAIERYDPAGPYLLVGYSYGGIVAYEVARELVSHGKNAGVVLLDTRLRRSGNLRRLEKRARAVLRRSSVLLSSVRALRKVRARLPYSREAALRKKEADLETRLAPRLAGPWHEEMMNSQRRLVRKYNPLSSDVPVVLIRADQSALAHEEPDYGWSAIANVLEVMNSPGNHVTFYQARNEEQFAQNLDRALDLLASELCS